MKFEHVALPLPLLWSSPFVRWQGNLADVSSLDLAAAVTHDALNTRQADRAAIDHLVVGLTIPQPHAFYAAPWLASRLGIPGSSGPLISQACATSVACIAAAAAQIEMGAREMALVVTTDRTSNGPLLVYPRGKGIGGSPTTEHWVLDNFAADPNTGQAMVATAENVARDGTMTRQALDALTLLRWQQYQAALVDDRRIQRRYLQPVVVARGKAEPLRIEADEGVHHYSAESLASLKPVNEGGVVTFGSQTHPADGCAGVVVARAERIRGSSSARVLAIDFARAAKAEMPKAATTAALKALDQARVRLDDVRFVVTHNPFAVNDLWFAQQTGFPLERMNPYGCSLIYGHPQGPTGLRGIVELAYALSDAGGGIGVFTGCAAGDTGAAVVVRVE